MLYTCFCDGIMPEIDGNASHMYTCIYMIHIHIHSYSQAACVTTLRIMAEMDSNVPHLYTCIYNLYVIYINTNRLRS